MTAAKTSAGILLSSVKDKLLHNRRIQQSGFTAGRSTIDRITTLNMLHQTRREFNRSLWVAYVDLKAAFDSVNCNALWDLLTSLGIPPKICSMILALFSGTISCVRVDGHTSEWFPILSGVRQGCTVAPDLFLVPMDWLMEHTSYRGMIGTTIDMEKEPLTDLDFANDAAFLAEMFSVLVLALEVMNVEAQPGP